MSKLTTAQKNKRKRERKKRERAERLEQEKAAAQKAKSEVLKDASETNNFDVDVEIEYVAEPLFPAANGDVNGDTNMAAPADGDAAANAAAEEDGQDLQAVMRRFQDRASVTYVVTDEETNNEGGDNKGSNEVNDADDEALEDENGEMLSKRKLKVSFVHILCS
jgi:hypothetical protein